ncbi:MAG: type II toxin-antitoxin system HicB family antitoxin [Thermomicrobiales bacterium]
MLEDYIAAAVEQATCEYLDDDDLYFCSIPALPGVWSSGDSPESARQELPSVIADWVTVGLERSHRIPVLAGIDLNTQSRQYV